MRGVKYINCFYQYRRKVTEEVSEEEWNLHSVQEVGELLQLPVLTHWTQEESKVLLRDVLTMDRASSQADSDFKDEHVSSDKSDKIPPYFPNKPNVETKGARLNNENPSQLLFGKKYVSKNQSNTVKLNKKQVVGISKRILNKPTVALCLRRSELTSEEMKSAVATGGQNQSENSATNMKDDQITNNDITDGTVQHPTEPDKDYEGKVDNCKLSSEDGGAMNEASTSCTDTERDSSSVPNMYDPSEQSGGDQKQTSSKQTLNAKSKIPLGLISRRGKSKLGDRAIIRRKSFLKRGDGANLIAKKRFLKQMGTRSSEGDRLKNLKNAKDDGSSAAKVKPSLLCMTGKRDASNSTFVKCELAGKKCGRKTLLENCRYSSKIEAKSGKRLPEETSKTQSKTTRTSTRSRKHWDETEVKSFEGMILSSILGFSDELRESTETINAKLQSLFDSVQGKSKCKSVSVRKTIAFSREWRQNNQDILDRGSQEIAGIFRNLRKVESNLKIIEETVTAMNKIPLRERLSSSKSYKILQKGK